MILDPWFRGHLQGLFLDACGTEPQRRVWDAKGVERVRNRENVSPSQPTRGASWAPSAGSWPLGEAPAEIEFGKIWMP